MLESWIKPKKIIDKQSFGNIFRFFKKFLKSVIIYWGLVNKSVHPHGRGEK